MINSDLLTPFGRLIRGARMRMGLTIEQAAVQLKIPARRLGHYESGMMVPGLNRCLAMAKFYGIGLEEFFDRRNHKEDAR